MKRFLSLILALAMLMALVPSAFASETAADIRIFYDISGDMTELGITEDSGKSLALIDYEHTNGFYKFFANTDSAKKDMGGYETQSEGTFKFRSGTGGGTIRIDRSYVAFEVYVPKAGTYDMQMYCAKNTWGREDVTVYMKKDAEALADVIVDDNKVGTYSCKGTDASTVFNINSTPSVITGIDIPDEGYYTFAFYVAVGYGYVGSFALTSGTGATVPMFATLGFETQTRVGTSLLMSDGSIVDAETIDGATMAYSSSNAAVATIDAVTGVITPVAKGETEISATVTVGDFSETAKITYNSPDMTPATARVTYYFNYYNAPGYSFTTDNYNANGLTYNDTNGFWRWISGPENTPINGNIGMYSTVPAGGYIAVGVYVPASGKYDIKYTYVRRTADWKPATDAELWILPASAEANLTEALESGFPVIDGIDHTAASGWNETSVTKAYTFPTAGEYIILTKSDNGGMIWMKQIDLSAGSDVVFGSVKVDETEFKIGEDATATASLYKSLRNSGSFAKLTTDITFTSSNERVATVAEDGTVTAVGAGKATISATVKGLSNGHVIGTEITVIADPALETVSFAALANIDVTIDGTNNVIDGTAARGTTVTLTAPDKEGYKFIGWKRGSAASGKFIKGAPQKEFEYTILSNACLTAMYEEENPTGTYVEFWNGNGEHLDTIAVENGFLTETIEEPTLIGFAFDDWYVDDTTKLDVENLVSSLTRAVAKYNDKADTFAVTDPDNYSNKINRIYDFAVTFTEDAEGTWTRNGNVVAYGKTYTYNTWDAADIEYTAGITDKAPLVVLEYSDTHKAYMIEYDKGDAIEIAEAGILFGNGVKPTVESGAIEKFASQRSGLSHGQFTAKPESTNANTPVGYIIYKDSEGYKVIYDTLD
ncbi:MAG: Ig-like domain-containing protein [Oscillospiraceae bacterium]|nr:Ig-like domain-containing protein [Oscillospiraceae bacterium]